MFQPIIIISREIVKNTDFSYFTCQNTIYSVCTVFNGVFLKNMIRSNAVKRETSFPFYSQLSVSFFPFCVLPRDN